MALLDEEWPLVQPLWSDPAAQKLSLKQATFDGGCWTTKAGGQLQYFQPYWLVENSPDHGVVRLHLPVDQSGNGF